MGIAFSCARRYLISFHSFDPFFFCRGNGYHVWDYGRVGVEHFIICGVKKGVCAYYYLRH